MWIRRAGQEQVERFAVLAEQGRAQNTFFPLLSVQSGPDRIRAAPRTYLKQQLLQYRSVIVDQAAEFSS